MPDCTDDVAHFGKVGRRVDQRIGLRDAVARVFADARRSASVFKDPVQSIALDAPRTYA